MASSLTKTPKECTDPPVSTDILQKYEDDLQDKTRQHLIDECIALKTHNVCLEALVQGLQVEEVVKENEELVARNRELVTTNEELARKIQEREQNYLAERVRKLEEDKIKLQEEIRSIGRDRKKDADTVKQELEACKKQVQDAQEGMFQPILGILKRQQELQRRENLYALRADENPYEEIQPGPPPHGNGPAHPPLHDEILKAPIQATDSLPTSSEESEPVSSNGEVMV
uniref:Uncharacterized protein n=1 Tax=Branchiostoma floridae TaxID=7739 RepID=C3XS98_BRAFL|eukprot:XP_002613104.1 hypothetical protein BRAFLDRAFT_89988 [Branchiostoma floridae]